MLLPIVPVPKTARRFAMTPPVRTSNGLTGRTSRHDPSCAVARVRRGPVRAYDGYFTISGGILTPCSFQNFTAPGWRGMPIRASEANSGPAVVQ